MMCVFGEDRKCSRCGYRAKNTPCYRVCVQRPAANANERRSILVDAPRMDDLPNHDYAFTDGVESFVAMAVGPRRAATESASGPGTELSKLLKRFGIEPTPTCQCRAKAAQMDAWGPDECEKPERIEEVVAVMRAEAEARGLPFLDVAGRMLVRRAIKNARKQAKMD